jgi:hypothetical protein
LVSVVSTVPTAALSWTRHVRSVDILIVALTIGMAALTLWLASAPIAHFFDFLILGFIWLPIGAVWALSLIVVRRPTWVLGAMVLVLLGVCSAIFGVGALGGLATTALIALIGLGGVLLVMSMVLGRAILLDRPYRIVWLVAPVIVVATLGLAVSELPRLARFAFAEPALTAYATDVLDQPRVKFPEETQPIGVGGLTIDWSAAQGGCAHLVTTYLGILGEYPAGLAYCPSGLPAVDDRIGDYDAFSGAWFLWASQSEFPFDATPEPAPGAWYRW